MNGELISITLVCRNPECRTSFKRMKGSSVTLCESCRIHPNLAAVHMVRDPSETMNRKDF